MIDLEEIAIASINAYEPGGSSNDERISTTFAQFLADEEVIDRLYSGVTLEAKGLGVCNSGFCGGIGQVYELISTSRATERQPEPRTYCKSHASGAVYYTLYKRLDTEFKWREEGREWMADLYQNMDLLDGYIKRYFTNTDSWPTIASTEPDCPGCGESLLNDEQLERLTAAGLRGTGYTTVTAYDADNNTYQVHNHCSKTCINCDSVYTYGRPYGGSGITNRMDFTSVQVIGLDDRQSGHWCETCVSRAKDNYDYTDEGCGNCGYMLLGPVDTELTVYSPLHGEHVCESCYDNGVDCDECGYTMYNNESHDCDYGDSDDDDDSSGIHNYSYKPRPIFYGIAPFMGFELEVEASGDRAGGVALFQNLDPFEKHYYLKSDGSLSYGFEIVSHPHDLTTYQSMDWSWLDKLSKKGFKSWNTTSCGLHVHIGLDAFKDENHQIRFTKFIYDNERQAKRIAGRSSGYATFDSKGKVIPKIKRKWQDSDRYTAVNVQNENTLEVRIFRGSLRKERVLSGIEFTHAVCEYTRDMKIIPKNKPFSWLRFAAYVAAHDDKYPNLFIIINETFERRSEIDTEQDGN